MLNKKMGTSIISLVLCAVAITMVTTALVLSNLNFAKEKANQLKAMDIQVVESSAYVKIYKLSEVKQIAKQAFVNNYLSLYDGKVTLDGFKALVIGEMMEKIPQNQLEEYTIDITNQGVTVVKN